MARKNALTQKVINKLLRGQHGHIWFNGKELATVQKCEAKMEGDFEDINVCGDPATYSVYNGWSGSGTLEYLKFDTEITKLVTEAFLSGEMPECQIITLLENENTGKEDAKGWDADKVRKMTFKRSVFIVADIKILGSMENLHFVVNMA